MWSSSECFRKIPIRVIMTCERIMWSSSESFRITPIRVIMTCELTMWSTLECSRIIPIRVNMTCERVMWVLWNVTRINPIQQVMMYEHDLRHSSKSFLENTHWSDSHVSACSVKFIKMFEMKNYQSDSGVLTSFEIVENNTHLGSYDEWACSVKFFKLLKTIAIDAILACEPAL